MARIRIVKVVTGLQSQTKCPQILADEIVVLEDTCEESVKATQIIKDKYKFCINFKLISFIFLYLHQFILDVLIKEIAPLVLKTHCQTIAKVICLAIQRSYFNVC